MCGIGKGMEAEGRRGWEVVKELLHDRRTAQLRIFGILGILKLARALCPLGPAAQEVTDYKWPTTAHHHRATRECASCGLNRMPLGAVVRPVFIWGYITGIWLPLSSPPASSCPMLPTTPPVPLLSPPLPAAAAAAAAATANPASPAATNEKRSSKPSRLLREMRRPEARARAAGARWRTRLDGA